MKIIKVLSVVVALHLIVLGFVFFKPPLNYFGMMCLTTIIVWAVVFSFKRRPSAAIIVGDLLQIIIQQVSYHAWVSPQSDVGWPLLQFGSLQYVVALRLGSSREKTTELGATKPNLAND